MAIDPSIYFAGAPSNISPAEYAHINAQTAASRAQTKLAEQQAQQQALAQVKQMKLSEIYQKALDPATGQLDQSKIYAGLAQAGLGSEIPNAQAIQAKAEQDKNEAALKKQQAIKVMSDSQKAELAWENDILNRVARYVSSAPEDKKPSAWDQAIDHVAGAYQKAGKDSSNIAKLKGKYDPDILRQTLAETETNEMALERLRQGAFTGVQRGVGDVAYQTNAQGQARPLMAGDKPLRLAPQVSTTIATMNKPPSGYRYTPDGGLEPIPGGPADRKILEAEEKKDNVRDKARITIETGERLLTHPGLSGAVGKWNLTRKVPGTEAATFAAELDAFKAQNFLPAVQSMRGLGQLSDAEGKKLTDAVGALSYNMTEEGFKASLSRILAELKRYQDRKPSSVKEVGHQAKDKTMDPATAAKVQALRNRGVPEEEIQAALAARRK